MYELLRKLEALIEEWENVPYTGDLTKATRAICARELRKVIGRPDYTRVRFVREKAKPHPVPPDDL